MRTSWDDPRPASRTADVESAAPAAQAPDGAVHPLALLRFVAGNLGRVVLCAVAVALLLFGAFSLVPFPYKATAIVLVDPRGRNLAPTPDVLPAIGADSAALESVVQIIQSDGFLAPVVEGLDLADDPEFAKAVARDPREALAAFRRKLNAERRGATYLVDVAFASGDPARAARYANAVADAFVSGQNRARSDAAQAAAGALSSRLVELRKAVRASEDAVAQFRISSGIVDVDATSTLSQREMSELTEQIALARARTEQARARFENRQASADAAEGAGPGAELTLLRRQRAELERTLSGLRLTYGDRHPRIADLQRQAATLDAQIGGEAARVGDSLRRQYEVAREEQAAAEAALGRMRERAAGTEEARVRLADLERQAAADRLIYEQYLARFKQTDEQRLLEAQDARVVSPALAPLRSTRPALPLAVAAFAAIGLCVSVIGLFLLSLRPARPRRPAPPVPAPERPAANLPATVRRPIAMGPSPTRPLRT